MAKTVIDGLEAVKVDDQQVNFAGFGRGGLCRGARDPVDKESTIGKTGSTVVDCVTEKPILESARAGYVGQCSNTPQRGAISTGHGASPQLEPPICAVSALQPEFLVWQDLADGRLETVMTDWTVPPIAVHLVTPPGNVRPLRVQVLIDFLARRFARAPWAAAAAHA